MKRNQKNGLICAIYRRSLNDTLITNLVCFQYDKITKVTIYSASFTIHILSRYFLRSIKNPEGALLISDFLVPWFQYSESTEDSFCHCQEFKALAFPDDDWYKWGNDIAAKNISIYNIDQISVVKYEDQLNENFSLIYLWAHSWSGEYNFKIENGHNKDFFFNHEIVPAHVNANFYIILVCGNGRLMHRLILYVKYIKQEELKCVSII